jgi:uncharacterized membrane protein YhaH (DUF805 family)
MKWYFDVFKKYADFSGRARRKEYWYWTLFNLIIIILLGIVDDWLFAEGALIGLYSLIVLVPGLAVTVRRLHDTGRSGALLLINFIPIVGSIILLFYLVGDSEPGTNKYGPNPKKVASLEKKCPFCAEMIKREAVVCRYCGRDLPEGEKKSDIPDWTDT